jgi:hypothetical protein
MATTVTGGAGLEIDNLKPLGSSITLTTIFPAVPAAAAFTSLPASIPFGATAVAVGGSAPVVRRP